MRRTALALAALPVFLASPAAAEERRDGVVIAEGGEQITEDGDGIQANLYHGEEQARGFL